MFLRRGLPLSICKSKDIKSQANHQILSRYLTEKCLGRVKNCLRWHFSPLQKGKKRGVKGRLERLEKLFFGTYFTLYTRVRGREEGARRGMKDPKAPLTETKNKLSKESEIAHNKLIINGLFLIKVFRNTFLQKFYLVIFGHVHFRSFWFRGR